VPDTVCGACGKQVINATANECCELDATQAGMPCTAYYTINGTPRTEDGQCSIGGRCVTVRHLAPLFASSTTLVCKVGMQHQHLVETWVFSAAARLRKIVTLLSNNPEQEHASCRCYQEVSTGALVVVRPSRAVSIQFEAM
jgi:hypothetical protein